MAENRQDSMGDQKPSSDETEKSGAHIRLRAILLGAILALAICIITPFNNAYQQATPLGGGHFPLAPFYALVWMMFLTAAIRFIFKGGYQRISIRAIDHRPVGICRRANVF